MGYTKTCTDEMNALDIRTLARKGGLQPGGSYVYRWFLGRRMVGSLRMDVLRHCVRFHNDAQAASIEAPLVHTPCNFGGARPWWRCPHCRRRVAILYVDATIACRHCWDLGYRVEREGKRDRTLRRAQTIRQRLGWPPGIFGNRGIRPKGMHQSTYKRLKGEHDRYAGMSIAELQRQFPLLQRGGAPL